jgi:antitoxin component YwqK of YwqJK toxin-antitoxin module
MCAIFFSFSSFSQASKQPQQVQLNGETYFIYPYGQKIKPHYSFARLLNYLDKEQLKKWYVNDMPKATTEDITSYLQGVDLFIQRIRNNTPKQHKVNQEMLKACLQNSDKFLQPSISLDVDIIPSLDALPDGKYIQYYEGYFHINPAGEITFKKDLIAGIFNLKKNTLHGKAFWLNSLGDTLKAGSFDNGVKAGKWMTQESEVSFYNQNKAQEIANKPLVFTRKSYTFNKGTMHGEYSKLKDGLLVEKGFYKEGVAAGEWFEYKLKTLYDFDKERDTSILKKHYTYASTKKISNKYFTRTAVFEEDLPKEKYDLPNYKLPKFDFLNLIQWNYEEEEDLELPEEKMTYYDGYQGEEYGNEYEMENYFEGDYAAFEYWNNTFYIFGKELKKSRVIDSIGYYNLYENLYEEFYDNGAIKVKYTFKNNDFEEEADVYWDNGKVANSITWNAALNVYEEKYFDYEGTLFTLNHFAKNGDFIKQVIDPLYAENHTNIDGFLVSIDKGDNILTHYEYLKMDTLRFEITRPTVLKKTWYANKGIHDLVSYDPSKRVIDASVFSFNGTKIEQQMFEYAPDFSSYRATINRFYKNLTCEALENGSYRTDRVDPETDTVPQARMLNYYAYEASSDFTLKFDEKPYSGTFDYTSNSKKNSFKLKRNKIQVAINTSPKFQRDVLRDMIENKMPEKSKFKELHNLLESNGRLDEQLALLFPELSLLLGNNNYIYDNVDYLKGTRIQGRYLDGKAHGLWKLFNEKGEVLVECTFNKGELDGIYKRYQYAFPEVLSDFDYYYDPMLNYQNVPKKVTRYLAQSEMYKNGMLQGISEQYDWQGGLLSRVNYDKGMEQGKAIERNPLVYTESNYDYGMLDGITSTYLTVPGKDSILLFNLNFQDGLLQGESKSYHTNGKLSKRGFFLNGRAIDDYEGYDSLGFKYHYVKFLYTFPVEEKIYEFNQLSVRYMFDWKDSIIFIPEDITNSSSVEGILYDMNLMGDAGEMPYMGRPSLIYKGNITYHMTKYYPNDTIARDGKLKNNRKIGPWYFNAYNGTRLYNVTYFDTILVINDSIKFKAKGILTDVDSMGRILSKSYIIERIEKYDCSHTDHYEQRQYYTFWQADEAVGRINGYVKNYYDNGTLQSEGNMKDGLPTGIWKLYDPYGQLNQVGEYVMGKRNGRWLSGDLSKSKYLGDICMNPNLPDLEERMEYQEKLLDIYIRYFKLGKVLNSEYYDLNLNEYEGVEEGEEK